MLDELLGRCSSCIPNIFIKEFELCKIMDLRISRMGYINIDPRVSFDHTEVRCPLS